MDSKSQIKGVKMGKKIAAITLGVGAFLIIILTGVLFYASHSLKEKLEVSLNSYFKTLSQATPIEFEPFSCSGLKNLTCVSDSFSINNILSFKNLTLRIYDLDKPDSLGLSLESPDFNFIDKKDINNIRNLINIFTGGIAPQADFSEFILPTSFQCDMQNTLQDQIIQNLTTCDFVAPNMNYTLTINTAQNPKISAKTLKEILFESYQLYQTDKEEFKKQFLVAFHSANLSIKSNQLKASIISEAKLKNPKFDPKLYENTLETSKNIAFYTFGLTSKDSKKPYYNEIIFNSLELISKILNEDIKGIQYDIASKKQNNFTPLVAINFNQLFSPESSVLKSKPIDE